MGDCLRFAGEAIEPEYLSLYLRRSYQTNITHLINDAFFLIYIGKEFNSAKHIIYTLGCLGVTRTFYLLVTGFERMSSSLWL